MADYYPLIARAVEALDKDTGENRRVLYERARTALVAQLRGVVPALDESEITRERLALEEAIRKVEAESARRAREEGRATIPPRRVDTLAREATARPSADAQRPVSDAIAAERPSERRSLSEEALKGFRDTVNDTDGRPPPPRRPERPATPPSPPPAVHPLEEFGQLEPRLEPDNRSGQPDPARTPADRPRASARPKPPPTAHTFGDDDIPRRSSAGRVGNVRSIMVLVMVLVLVGAAAAVTWWQRDAIGGSVTRVMAWVRSSSTPPATPGDTATPTRPKDSDRIGQPNVPQPGAPVAQRAVLYEEDPDDPQGKRLTGTVVWSTEMLAPAPGRPAEMAVRARIEVPERRMVLTWSLRRNTDASLPASHTIEITFNLPQDAPSGGVQNVPGVLMKQTEQTRGVPLVGLAVKVTPGYFLIGLSSLETDTQRNLQLLKERGWFDIPIVYNNNRRAILAMEKGIPGEKALNDAFAAWKQ